MKARQAVVETIYNNYPISGNIKDDTQSFTYTDNASDGSDSISLTIICTDGKWTGSWMPTKKARLQSTIRVTDWLREGDHRQLGCGSFLLDDLSFEGEPRTMSIGAVSAPADKAFSATKRTQTWQFVTVRQIAQTVAARSGISLEYDGPDYTIEAIEQDETDSAFMQKVADAYGLSMKVYSHKLVLFDREAYKLRAAAATIDVTDMESWHWNTTLDGLYTGGQLDYTDQDKDADIHAQIGSGDRWLKLNQRASSPADAGIQLAAALNKKNHGTTTLVFTTMGNVSLVAGQCINVTGLGQLDGKYYIDSVKHSLSGSGSGYTCEYSVSLCGSAFSGADANGYITYNQTKHDTYAQEYKSTYQASTGAGGGSGGSAKAGTAVTLSKCPLYYTSTAKTKSNTVSGTYYLYDGINVAGRYRITKPASRCGKLPVGQNVTGWIDASYVK